MVMNQNFFLNYLVFTYHKILCNDKLSGIMLKPFFLFSGKYLSSVSLFFLCKGYIISVS